MEAVQYSLIFDAERIKGKYQKAKEVKEPSCNSTPTLLSKRVSHLSEGHITAEKSDTHLKKVMHWA